MHKENHMNEELDELITEIRAMALGAEDIRCEVDDIWDLWHEVITQNVTSQGHLFTCELLQRAYECLEHAAGALEQVADIITGQEQATLPAPSEAKRQRPAKATPVEQLSLLA